MKYKLVPVNPTREMWAAAGDAVVALNSQHHDAISEAVYKAMLAAAPDFDRHVIAEVNEDDDGYWADILPGQYVHLGQPLYGVMQPAPDVSELVTALESIAEYWNGDANDQAMLDALDHASVTATTALEAYRQQAGDV